MKPLSLKGIHLIWMIMFLHLASSAQELSFKDFLEKQKVNYSIIGEDKAGDYSNSRLNAQQKTEWVWFNQALTRMIKEEQSQSKLKGSVEGGVNQDHALGNNFHRLTAGFNFSRGTYPGELSLESSLTMTLSNGTLTEQLSKLQISYDLYFEDQWEGYFFLGRASDKFMSLDQRYEIGAGMVFEFRPKTNILYHRKKRNIPDKFINQLIQYPRTKDTDAIQRALYRRVTAKGRELLRDLEMDTVVQQKWFADTVKQSSKVQDDVKKINAIRTLHTLALRVEQEKTKNIRSIFKEYQKIRFSVLLGLSTEVDQYTLKEKVNFDLLDLSTKEVELSQTLPGDFRVRAVFRPKLVFQKGPLKLSLMSYLKPGFAPQLRGITGKRTVDVNKYGGPSPGTANQYTRWDFRMEDYLELAINSGAASFSFNYLHFYDRFTPRAELFPDAIENIAYDNTNYKLVSGAKHHHVVRLIMKYTLP